LGIALRIEGTNVGDFEFDAFTDFSNVTTILLLEFFQRTTLFFRFLLEIDVDEGSEKGDVPVVVASDALPHGLGVVGVFAVGLHVGDELVDFGKLVLVLVEATTITKGLRDATSGDATRHVTIVGHDFVASALDFEIGISIPAGQRTTKKVEVVFEIGFFALVEERHHLSADLSVETVGVLHEALTTDLLEFVRIDVVDDVGVFANAIGVAVLAVGFASAEPFGKFVFEGIVDATDDIAVFAMFEGTNEFPTVDAIEAFDLDFTSFVDETRVSFALDVDDV